MNLIVNARDAMPQGGRLTIETKNVDLEAGSAQSSASIQPGPHVMLAVSDTGIGMDAETQARLFEPFFTAKDQGQGTGMGLSTVYGIVKQNREHILVSSHPGRGTTFKLYFPLAAEEESSHKPTELSTKPPPESKTILLVDDEDVIRRLASVILQLKGYTVLEAKDGTHAVQTCLEHDGPIHLLVTDVVMPEMNGRQMAERITQMRPDIKVLYVSGYAPSVIFPHGVLSQDRAFLQKPFTPDSLTHKVREVLGLPA